MKYGIILFLGLCITSCFLRKEREYILPTHLNEEAKKNFADIFLKGKKSYKISCANCHNREENGKSQIPEFTARQLKSYSIRMGNNEHSVNLTEQKVSAQELRNIIFFLSNRKKRQ